MPEQFHEIPATELASHSLSEEMSARGYLLVRGLMPAEVLRSLEPFVDHDLDHQRILEVGIGSVSAPNTAFKGERQSPVGRWRTSLSPEELAEFETLTGDMLADLGYELNARHATSFELTRMRTAYRMYFESKQYLKTKTLAGKWLVERNLSWV